MPQAMAEPLPDPDSRPPLDAPPDRERSALDVVLRCFASAVGADTAMLLGCDRADRPALLSAWGLADGRSTAPWVSSSFLGEATTAPGPTLEPAPTSNGDAEAAAWIAVAAPIVGPDAALGLIYAGFERPAELPAGDLRWIAQSHADLAALCMSGRGDSVADTLRSSGIDQLTGCLSHERVMEMIRAEVERSKRKSHPLCCCFLDLDGFKAINDDYGHLEGNRILAAAGRALRAASRPYDGVARFGGDEFVVILPDTGARAAHRTVERMRWRVTFTVQHETGRTVAASAGVAQWEPGASALQLLEASDHALQVAKARGGARVAGDLPSERRFDGLVALARATQRPAGGDNGDVRSGEAGSWSGR
jgi:diguanylate cyclase (GGDEF)-like protein